MSTARTIPKFPCHLTGTTLFAYLLVAFVGSTFIVTGASAQTATHKVRVYFNFGDAVEIELYGNESPLHVANFLNYVTNDSYDNSFIHRSAFGSLRFLQGGSFLVPPAPTASNLLTVGIATGAPVVNEFDASNGLSNTPGTLAAARTPDPDSATSGWFINITNNAPGFDPGPYTVFGQVTNGLDLLNQVTLHPVLSDVHPSFAGSGQASAPLIYGESLFVIDEVIEVSLLSGDFNANNVVDGNDLALFEQDYGSTSSLAADANGNRIVGGGDFLTWQRNEGTSASTTSSLATVPEPTSVALACLALLATFHRRPLRNS